MQQKATTPSTLIVINGRWIEPTARELREQLGGPQVVDVYLDGSAGVRGSRRNRLQLLRNALERRIITPLKLSLFYLGKYQQVICYFSKSGYVLGMINRLLPKRRRPRLIWVHFTPPPAVNGIKGWFKEQMTYLGLQGFDLLICPTKPLIGNLRQRFPEASHKLAYVRWGGWDEVSGKLEQGSLEVSDGGYVFCGGRTNRDFDTVLAAVRELNIPTKLVMGTDVKLKGEVPEHVEIYRDIPAEQFQKLLAGASVVVVPLLKPDVASGSQVLSRAMWHSKAIVVTNIAGMDDYVSDGYDALLVKPHDPVDLSEKLALLMNNSDLRIRLAKNGYEAVKKKLNSDTSARELAQVITQTGPQQIPREIGVVSR